MDTLLYNNWLSRYLIVPVFGLICFALGAALLVTVSAGHWRTSGWPTFQRDRDARLAPSRVRVGSRIYYSADVAMTIGFVVLIVIALTVLTLWWAGVFSRKF